MSELPPLSPGLRRLLWLIGLALLGAGLILWQRYGIPISLQGAFAFC